ncbi:MAG: hypothetical protein HZC41_26420 [Chloroflexi bacterium]|nr:hypothetical protein [Chloroflexota bacterium]
MKIYNRRLSFSSWSVISMSVDTRLRVLLGCLLLGVYLLVYTPRPDSADGQAILAVTAATLRHGVPEIGAIGALDALLPLQMARMGAFGVDGAPYSKKGITPSLALLPLVLLSDALPWLDTRATALLLNPMVTTATALLLYTLVRWLDYRPRTAFVMALLYGLATTALVYAKTLYGEPLAALLLLGAVMGGYRFYHAAVGTRYIVSLPIPSDAGATIPGRLYLWLILSGACLGLLAGVNLVYVLVAPVVGAVLLLRMPVGTRSIVSLRQIAAFVLPVLTALALLGLYNWVRFGSPASSGYHFAAGEGFTQPVLVGLYGLTISPYRGLFWYSPILLLALPGWLMLRRRAPWLAWLALALATLQLLAFASWWSWHGGIAWGPRFLVPALPLLALLLAPLVEAAWRSRLLALVIAAFAGLSSGVQILGAAYSVYHHIGYLYAHYYTGDVNALVGALSDEVLVHPGLSAILGHLALARVGWPLEPAWAAAGIDGVQLLAVGALVAAGVIVYVAGAHRRAPLRRMLRVLPFIVAFTVLNIVASRHSDATARDLEAALQPPGTVVVASTLFGDALLDLDGRWRTFSTNAPTDTDDPLTRRLWNYALRQDKRLWLLTWFPPADRANWQEAQLWQSAAFIAEGRAADHRTLLFDLSPAPANRDGGQRFGSIRLARYGVLRETGAIKATLAWSADEAPTGDYYWFVHVIDAGGSILAQQDRTPLGGYAPTSDWVEGATVTDRLAFLGEFPADARLRIGWTDPATGDRLPAFDADGTPQPDGYVIIEAR